MLSVKLFVVFTVLLTTTAEGTRSSWRKTRGRQGGSATRGRCTRSSDPLCCDSAESCYDLADDLQVDGTQSSFIQSTVVLYNAINKYPNDASLFALYGKLNLFYLLNWDVADTYIQQSLSIDDSINNLNCYLFAGWLHGTIGKYRNSELGFGYFEDAINLIEDANETSNFWPYFEYATFLSVIGDDYTKAQEYYEVSIEYGGGYSNPFINFFYGLLLRYHLGEIEYGESLITSAISVASFLPKIAASNVAFQSSLLNSKRKIEEAQRCCEFAYAIMPSNASLVDFLCLNGTDPL